MWIWGLGGEMHDTNSPLIDFNVLSDTILGICQTRGCYFYQCVQHSFNNTHCLFFILYMLEVCPLSFIC